MTYVVEVVDRNGLRVGRFTDVPLLEVTRTGPDGDDRIEGLLPLSLARFGVGYTVRVLVEGAVVAHGTVTSARPAWGDIRRLIVDRYVDFQELLSVVAIGRWEPWNRHVSVRMENRPVDEMVRTLINHALGAVHYTVAHGAYPDGAVREYEKFIARKALAGALPYGGIDSGQWVGGARIDTTGAYAKDGDTIAGLVVDGVTWPDLRLMMVDCEESSLNSHGIGRHPETATWDSARYARSVYKQRADGATARLQAYMDEKGIDYIELNPHQDGGGDYDDRVDAYGRYIGLVYGGGECFNAGLVEEGHGDVYLYDDGRFHVPEMALKDFYSYVGEHEDSIAPCETVVGALDIRGGVLEAITALAAMGDGYVFQVDVDGGVHFRRGDVVDAVVPVVPTTVGVELGRDIAGLANLLHIEGNPIDGVADDYYAQEESIDLLGTASRYFPYYALSRVDDGALLGQGLLRDLAWPARVGRALFYRGVAHLVPGTLLEFRGDVLEERDEPVAAGWADRLGQRLVGRVSRVVHRLAGATVETQLDLTSPYRSVASPLSFITRSQDSLSEFFQFRLDDPTIGLDIGFHLD